MAHFYTPENPYTDPYLIKGVAFDNDNTLYVEPEFAKELHEIAAFYAVKDYFPNIEEEEYRRQIAYSRDKYNGSLEVFSEEYGLDPERLRQKHYKHLIGLVGASDFFDPEGVPLDELDELRINGVPMVMATHGNMDWSLFSSKITRLSDYFNEQSIVTKDHTGINKAEGPEMYHVALDRFGVPRDIEPEKRGVGYAMIEDTAKNLKYAKELGMTTVLIDSKLKPEDKVPDYVDVVVPNNRAAIRCLLMSNQLLYRQTQDTDLSTSDDYDAEGYDVA